MERIKYPIVIVSNYKFLIHKNCLTVPTIFYYLLKYLKIKDVTFFIPIVKNWVEEVVWEWLLLKGYTTICDIRLKSAKRMV
ncbi:MAG: hypothetical protein QXP32_06155 [Nitrososphaeria archaeon]